MIIRASKIIKIAKIVIIRITRVKKIAIIRALRRKKILKSIIQLISITRIIFIDISI